jgi:short-subunit dehydrogenase
MQGKRVMVTGASSGIGEATARAFAAAGAALTLTSEREQDLMRVTEDLRKAGATVTPIVVDFTRPEQVSGLWDRAESEAGVLDVLVNNAGVGLGAQIEQIKERELRFVFEVNFFALFSLSQQALIRMGERGQGRIINVSSSSGRIGLPGVAAYAASKGACHTLTAALRLEASAKGVLVSEVLPISVRTKFFENVKGEKYQPHGLIQTAEHVAAAMVRCAASRRPMPEVLPYRLVRFAFIADAILPGILDRFLRGKEGK